jgi:glutaredoxin
MHYRILAKKGVSRMSTSETTLYVKAGCPYCARISAELKRKGVKFKQVDVSADAAALRHIKEKYGARIVPVLVEGEKVSIGLEGNG